MPAETPQTKIVFRKRDLAIIVAGLIVLLVAILYTLDRIRNRHEPAVTKNEASSSASEAYCADQLTFENQKQGYKVCLDTDYASSDESDHKVASEIVLKSKSASASGKPTIRVDVSFKGGIKSTAKTKSDEKPLKVDAIDAIQYKATTTTGNKSVTTLFDNFGRTYSVTMESTPATYDSDLLTYNSVLASWLFLPATPNPPWASSGNLFVNKPWPKDTVKNPFVIEGQAQVFEGVVNIRVKDSAGNILINTIATTSSGTQLSAFTKSISYSKASTSNGVIEVFSLSARNGAEQDKISIPITFAK